MRPLSDRLSSDFFMIATALFLAFVIWMTAKSSSFSQESLDVPLELVNVPPNVEARLNREMVQISLEAPQALVAQLQPSDFKVQIDWDKYFPEPRSWCGVEDFRPSNNIMPGVEDVRFTSDVRAEDRNRVRIIMVHRGEKKTNVEARFITHEARAVFRTQGRPARGYRLADISSRIKSILLTAAPSRLKELAPEAGPIDLETEPIDLTDRRESFVEEVRLLLPPETELVDMSRRIEAQVSVEEIIASRRISRVQIEIRPLNEDLVPKFSPDDATVTVSGPQHLVDAMRPSDLVVRPVRAPAEEVGLESTVDLTGDFSSQAPPKTIENVSILSVEPEAILLHFQPREGARGF